MDTFLTFYPAVSGILPDDRVTPMGEPISDHELMRAVRAGDLGRLGELFERHHRPLFGFFLRLTNQAALSEDLVQLAFFQVIKYRHTYRETGSFSAWLYQIARNLVASHYRKSARSPVPVDLAAVPELADAAPAPDRHATDQENLSLLHAALDQLPPTQRELLVLSHLHEVDHHELAQIFGCTLGAVRVRVHRALKELRKAYLALHGEPES